MKRKILITIVGIILAGCGGNVPQPVTSTKEFQNFNNNCIVEQGVKPNVHADTIQQYCYALWNKRSTEK